MKIFIGRIIVNPYKTPVTTIGSRILNGEGEHVYRFLKVNDHFKIGWFRRAWRMANTDYEFSPGLMDYLKDANTVPYTPDSSMQQIVKAVQKLWFK